MHPILWLYFCATASLVHTATWYLLLYLPLRGCQLLQSFAKWQRRPPFLVLPSSLPWSSLLLLLLTCCGIMSAETVDTCNTVWREQCSWVGPKACQPANFPPGRSLLVAGLLAFPCLLTVLGCFCAAWPAAAVAACWLLRKILLGPLPAPALPLAMSVLFLTMLCWGV